MLKRIALISEHASPLALAGSIDSGGQNIYVAQVASHLAQLGYEVDVFTRRDQPLLPEIAEWTDRVRIIHVPAGPACFVRKEDLLPYMDDFSRWMIRFCARQSQPYHIIHANFWMSGLVALRLKEAFSIPFVITFHALGHVRRQHQRDADEFPETRLAIEKRLVREADHLVAECPQDRHDLLELYGADPARITIIPCGFDPGEFWPIGKALARAAVGLDPAQPTILQIGRLVPRKGVDTVIRALDQLRHRHSTPARLVIVGGNSDRPDPQVTPEIGRLQQIAREYGVADQVLFTGRKGRDLLKFYYSAADVFVTTPWYEPFGITPLEAMACATPVVASRVGGLKFTVRHGQNGFLVPPNDPEQLAERIAALYQWPGILKDFGQAARRFVHQAFTWHKVTVALAHLYRGVLQGSTEWMSHSLSWGTERRQNDRRQMSLPVLGFEYATLMSKVDA